jgi:CubicO group peptidase (beta-lactamase class C family)
VKHQRPGGIHQAMTAQRPLLILLLSTNLLAACVAPDGFPDEDAPDESTASAGSITFPPCFFLNYKLAQIADGAGATIAAGGAPGWTVFVARRPAGQTEPCVATSSGGYARSYLDGYRAFSPDVSFPIASNSKIITAVATVDILAKHGISRNASIAPYLPSDWALGPGVSNITFAQLLTHTSGLTPGSLANGWGSDLEADLRFWLLLGVTQPSKPFSYSNSGMALLQLLAARIQFGPVIYLSNKLAMSGSMLATHVAATFFSPHGIPASGTPSPSCTFSDTSSTLAYPTGSQPVFWGGKLSPATDLARCGFGRWNFTARNLGRFLDRLWNGDLLGEALTTELVARNYGFDPTSADYMTKGGLLPSGDSQFKSRTYIFPDGTVGVVLINSDAAIGTALPDAYDAAN